MVKRGLIAFLMSLNIPFAQKLKLAADCAEITVSHRHFPIAVTRTDLGVALLRAGQLKEAYRGGIKDESRLENCIGLILHPGHPSQVSTLVKYCS